MIRQSYNRIREFEDVFHMIYHLGYERTITYGIDLNPGRKLVSRSLYRLDASTASEVEN